MLDVRVNLLKNRLYITLGRGRKHKLENSIQILENAADKLTPGFTCVTRITDCRGFDSTENGFCARIEKLLSDRGMAHLIRIGDVDTANSGNCEIADTMESADQILDLWETTRIKQSAGMAN